MGSCTCIALAVCKGWHSRYGTNLGMAVHPNWSHVLSSAHCSHAASTPPSVHGLATCTASKHVLGVLGRHVDCAAKQHQLPSRVETHLCNVLCGNGPQYTAETFCIRLLLGHRGSCGWHLTGRCCRDGCLFSAALVQPHASRNLLIPSTG